TIPPVTTRSVPTPQPTQLAFTSRLSDTLTSRTWSSATKTSVEYVWYPGFVTTSWCPPVVEITPSYAPAPPAFSSIAMAAPSGAVTFSRPSCRSCESVKTRLIGCLYCTSTVWPTVTYPCARASIVCRSAPTSPLNGAGPMSRPSMNTVALAAPPTATDTSAVLFSGSILKTTGVFAPEATSTGCTASTNPSLESLSTCLPTSVRTGPGKGVLPMRESCIESAQSGSLPVTSIVVTNCCTIATAFFSSVSSVAESCPAPSVCSFSQASTARA